MPDPGGSDALAPDSATVAASEPIYADFLGLMRHNPLPSDRLSEVDMAAWFRVLFNSQGDRLIHDLRALPDPQATATAVLRHLPWTALEALIVGLNPAMGGFVITMLLAGEKAALRRKEQSRHTLQNALWHAALSLTLDPRGPKGDATAVAGRVVTSAARHGAINTDEILHALREGAHAGAAQDARFHPLEEILPALRGAMPSGGHSDTRSTHRPAVQTSGPSASAIPRQTHAATNQKQEYDLAPPASTIPSDPLSVAIAYLRYGTLPAGETKSDICKRIEAVIAAALGAGSSAQLSWLLPLLTVPLHRFRLMQCISTAVAMDLMDQVRPDGRRVMRLLDELAPLVCESLPGLTLDEWTSIALSIALGPPPDAAEPDTGFLRNALQTASAKRSLLYADTIAALAAHGGAIQGLSSNARDAIAGLVVPIAEESQSDPGATPPVIADAALDGLRTAAPDRLHVDNAGLVLLWPYLPRLFSTLHLLDDHGFCHTESQLRAVHLTQLLVSGDHSTPEHMLPLNKLLCGLGLTHPVGLDITPTPKETDLVHDLLYSVTQTWEPLRNTTIEGLRESFLIRNGLLQRTSPAAPMTLSVETRAFDMLLDRLPWSLSVIKLHWMSEELHVRWR